MKFEFYRFQRAYSDLHSSSFTNMNKSTALVGSDTRGSRGGTSSGRRGGGGRSDSRGHDEIDGHNDLGEGSSVISCFYYKEPGHIKKFYSKLIEKNT